VDRNRYLRECEHSFDRLGGTQRSVGPRALIGVWIALSLRRDSELVQIGPGRKPVGQPHPQPKQHHRRVQRHRPGRRREEPSHPVRQLERHVGANDPEARLP
jgi:hypothetical protein